VPPHSQTTRNPQPSAGRNKPTYKKFIQEFCICSWKTREPHLGEGQTITLSTSKKRHKRQQQTHHERLQMSIASSKMHSEKP